MYPHHPSFNSLGALDGQFPNPNGRFHNQIQSSQGAPNPNVPNYEFLGNQLPWKDPIQGQYGHQPRGFERSAELPSYQQQLLQSQQQTQMNHQQHVQVNHQQQIQATHQHQLQVNRQQLSVEQPEPPVQFPETSYSALLHGPDTPPFQPEPAWDVPITEPENHEGINASYSGFPNNYNYNMEKDQNPDPQLGFNADPTMYVADGGAFHPHILEHPNSTLNLPSKNNEGITMFPMYSQIAPAKDRSSLPMPKLQQTAEQQLMGQNQISKGYQLSNSQHSSQDYAFRQPRSWGPFDQKWDGQNQGGQPMDAIDPSFQSFPNPEQNNSLQMHQHHHQQQQQYPTSVDTGNSRSGFGHYQQQSGGSIMPEDGGFKQQQEWNMPSREVPPEIIANEKEHPQYNTWNASQMQRMPPGFGNHSQLGAPNKRTAWGTDMLQNGRYVVENDTSNSMHSEQPTANSMQTGWQTPHVETSDSMSSMPGTSFQPYEEGMYSSGFPRTRQDSGGLSGVSRSFSHPLEAYDQYQGAWKSHPSQKQFAPGVDNSYSSFNGDRNPGHWAPEYHQGTNETEAMAMKSGLMGHQDHVSGQQHNHKMFSACEGLQSHHTQAKPIQGPLVNQYAPDRTKDFSVKSTPNSTPDRGIPSYDKDDESEGPRPKRQREFSGFGNAPYIRPNHSSSSWSPQNMKLGLAPPPSLSNNLQHAGSMGQMKTPGVQELERNFNSNSQPLLDSHVVETETEHESGSLAASQQHNYRMLSANANMQRTMMAPSSSPLARQGSMMSETPPGFSHGQMISGENRGLGPTHSSVEPMQMHGPHMQGKLPNGPNAVVGNDPRQLAYEINNPQVIQDQPRSDPFMNQIRDRTKASNFPDLLTNWKSSLSQQPMKMLDQTKSFPEGLESSRGTSSGVLASAPDAMLEPQLNTAKPNSASIYSEDPHSLNKPNIGSQNYEGECNNLQGNFRPKQSVSIEAIEMTPPNAQVKPQMQRISPSPSSSSPLNGFRQGHLQAQSERQDWNQFVLSKGMSPQSTTQLGRFSRPPMDMLFPQSHQNQMENAQAHPATWASRVFESAVLAGGRVTNETVTKHLHTQPNPGVMGKGGMHALASDGVGSHQQQNTSFSDSRTQSSIPSDQFPTKDVGRNSNSGVTNFEMQRSSGHYSRIINNEQLIPSQSFAYQNRNMHSRDFPFPQQMDPSQHQVNHYSVNHPRNLEHFGLKDGEPSLAPRTLQEQHQPLMSKPAPVMIHPKKRKSSVSVLIPWHVGATQPRGQLISISKSELMWANATNRIPEKNIEENHDDNTVRARARLRLTTQLMQQLIPPVSSVLMQGSNPMDNECMLYNLSKVALGEACRLMINTEKEADAGQKGTDGKPTAVHGQTRTPGITKEVTLARLTERFTEKIKVLEKECSRLDSALSGMDLKGKTQDLEKLSTVNRLAKGYGTGFLDPSENVFVEKFQDYNPGMRRPMPQKYVIAIPMPRTLPEDVRCLSL